MLDVGHLGFIILLHYSLRGHIIVLNSIFSPFVKSILVYDFLKSVYFPNFPLMLSYCLLILLICFSASFLIFSSLVNKSKASLKTGTNFLFSKSSSGLFFWASCSSFYKNILFWLPPFFSASSLSFESLSPFFFNINSAINLFI